MTASKKPPDDELALLEERAGGSGYVPTRLRRVVLRLLLEAGGPLKAYDMVEAARAQGHKLTPATAYRVLDYLQAAELVHKVNSLNSYVVCSRQEPGPDHHPFILVCPDCRKATEIIDSGLSEAVLARLDALGHGVEGASVEIHGLCRVCAAK
jgi:Fur family zinc uptake transcriptional regulator